MSEAVTLTSLRSLIKSPFQGEKWQDRFLIGAGLTLAVSLIQFVAFVAGFILLFIPFVGVPLILAGILFSLLPAIFVAGYNLRIVRQAINGEELSLPAWGDWGKLASDGLRLLVVDLAYLLPGILVFCAGMILYFITIFTLSSPRGPAVYPPGDGFGMMTSFFTAFGIFWLSMFLGWLLMILGAIPLPVATAHFVARDKLAAAFHVREWWRLLRANKLGYLIAWVVIAGLYTILYTVLMLTYYTLVLVCLLPFLAAPVFFYLSLVGAALFGQTYRESLAMLSEKAAAEA